MASQKFCDCVEDGWCPRYRREMGGRMRELCAGVNVDLGTAAAFREQWRTEATGSSGADNTNTPDNRGTLPVASARPLLLVTEQAPGDAVVMTAAVHSLHRAHPDKYLTAVDSPWPEVFAHNPDVVPAESVPSASALHMHYPAIHRSNHCGIHFMQGWCEFLGAVLGIPVPLLTNRPHLYFAEPPPLVADFWLVCSGGKDDFTNKLWGHHNYQRVVGSLSGLVNFVQVGHANDKHPRLLGTYDMVGGTTLRGLFNLVRRSRGVLCGVSLLMHVAAALEKPAVIIAGGREPRSWNTYPRQAFISNAGWLSCSDPQGHVGGACWRSRVVPLGDGTLLDRDTCQYPVDGIPKCMRMITSEYVAKTIMQVEDGYACVK